MVLLLQIPSEIGLLENLIELGMYDGNFSYLPTGKRRDSRQRIGDRNVQGLMTDIILIVKITRNR